MSEQDKLTDEDMKRVKKYLNSGFNVTERKPFRRLGTTGYYMECRGCFRRCQLVYRTVGWIPLGC